MDMTHKHNTVGTTTWDLPPPWVRLVALFWVRVGVDGGTAPATGSIWAVVPNEDPTVQPGDHSYPAGKRLEPDHYRDHLHFIFPHVPMDTLHFQHLRGIWPLDLFHKGSPHIYQRLHPYSIMGYWQSIMPWVPQPGGGGGLPGCLRATSPTCSPYQGNPPDSGRSGGSQNNGQSVLSVSVC